MQSLSDDLSTLSSPQNATAACVRTRLRVAFNVLQLEMHGEIFHFEIYFKSFREIFQDPVFNISSNI